MNVHGYFQSMRNAIAKEKTGAQVIRENSEGILARWEIISKLPHFSARFKEIGDGHAANLRGSLKSFASHRAIESLTSDLEWCLRKGLK